MSDKNFPVASFILKGGGYFECEDAYGELGKATFKVAAISDDNVTIAISIPDPSPLLVKMLGNKAESPFFRCIRPAKENLVHAASNDGKFHPRYYRMTIERQIEIDGALLVHEYLAETLACRPDQITIVKGAE